MLKIENRDEIHGKNENRGEMSIKTENRVKILNKTVQQRKTKVSVPTSIRKSNYIWNNSSSHVT